MDNKYQIESEAALEAVLGQPMEFLRAKVVSELDDSMTDFIGKSPLAFISTLDAQGGLDVSPKGDPAGFVQVDEKGNLLIPERPGNKLAFGFRNILANQQIGMIFVVPNIRETLRVKGRATLHSDPQVLGQMEVGGKPALLYTHVEVQECFFHCGKAMIRSKMWQPEYWGEHKKTHMVEQLASTMDGDEQLAEILETEIEKNYEQELY